MLNKKEMWKNFYKFEDYCYKNNKLVYQWIQANTFDEEDLTCDSNSSLADIFHEIANGCEDYERIADYAEEKIRFDLDIIWWPDDMTEAALKIFEKELFDGINDISFIEADDFYDVGYYFVAECGILGSVDNDLLKNYFDYAAYGRDIVLETYGGFSNGYYVYMS